MVPSSQILSGAGACLATGVNQRPQGLPLGAVPFRSVGFGPAPSTPPPILALSLLFERSDPYYNPNLSLKSTQGELATDG